MIDANLYAPHIEVVARHLLGEPNHRLSSQRDIRFGTHGSIAVDCEKGVWFDHETNVGGGVLDLIKKKRGLTGAEAIDWLREHDLVLSDAKVSSQARVNDRAPVPRVTAEYVYRQEDGEPYLRVQRTDRKDFWQSHWTGAAWSKGKSA